MDGLILVNKEKGISSFGVVSKIRKLYNVKKVGHTGTLDPEAEGVLPILIGEATKLSKFFIEHDKSYRAVLKLGIMTDSGDKEGKVIDKDDFKLNLDVKEKCEKVFRSFIGKQNQIPPMYSALKVNGKKLYEYARDGIEIERKAREIEIYNINILNFNFDSNEIEFDVECSKGTYIRTLCEDIAKKIGTIGYMERLIRTKVDDFCLEESHTLEEIDKSDCVDDFVISIEKLFIKSDKVVLSEEKNRLFLNGGRIKVDNGSGLVRVYCNMRFIGIGMVEGNILKREVVL